MAGVSLPKLSHAPAMTEATNSPAVSVIVPLFNEEENMSLLQSELRAALGGLDHEIVFVDDGSVDRTVERIKPAPNIRVIRFEKNRGQSAAIYAGLRAARGATAVLIDGDLQNDPVDIPVNHRPRRFGQSKYGLGNRALRATIDMFGVRWLLSRRLNYKVRDSDGASS